MTLHLLDTNIVSHIFRRDQPVILSRMRKLPANSVALSAITKGELIYGLRKRGSPKALSQLISDFLQTVTVLPWTTEDADTFGHLKAECRLRGKALADLDMLIAAQAITAGATLITRDKAFAEIGSPLRTDDWVE